MIKPEYINHKLIGEIVIYKSHLCIEVGKVTSISPKNKNIRCLFRAKIDIDCGPTGEPHSLSITKRNGDTSESCSPSDLTLLDFYCFS